MFLPGYGDAGQQLGAGGVEALHTHGSEGTDSQNYRHHLYRSVISWLGMGHELQRVGFVFETYVDVVCVGGAGSAVLFLVLVGSAEFGRHDSVRTDKRERDGNEA